jgi:membrane associated rhomboid family serine protease
LFYLFFGLRFARIPQGRKKMIPLKDDNPRLGFPLVNTLLIVVNIAIFLHQIFLPEGESERFIFAYGAIPEQISRGLSYSSLITSMFLHGGLLHILGNMLYLFIFGDNVEGLMGSGRYLIFYVLCGLGAALSHILIEPASAVPMIGASGAISGVLGAYMISYPKARVLVLLPIIFYVSTFRVPAVLVLGLWFVNQLISAFAGLGGTPGGSGIAWFAHIGGFVVGLLLVKFFAKNTRRAHWRYDYD